MADIKIKEKYGIHHSRILPGNAAFHLMDREGLPVDLCMELCAEKGILFDVKSFLVAAQNNKNFRKKRSFEALFDRVKFYYENIFCEAWWEKMFREYPEHFIRIRSGSRGN